MAPQIITFSFVVYCCTENTDSVTKKKVYVRSQKKLTICKKKNCLQISSSCSSEELVQAVCVAMLNWRQLPYCLDLGGF